MPSDVPDVSSTRSGSTASPRVVKSSATATRASRMPGRGRVAVVAVPHRGGNRLDQVGRADEPEGDRVADVEVRDLAAGGLHLLCLDHDVPDRVAEPVDTVSDRQRRAGERHGRIVALQDVTRTDDNGVGSRGVGLRLSGRPTDGAGPIRASTRWTCTSRKVLRTRWSVRLTPFAHFLRDFALPYAKSGTSRHFHESRAGKHLDVERSRHEASVAERNRGPAGRSHW